MIRLQVIGNLGKDAVVNEVSGRTVINFSVAHTDKYKDAQGNLQERTTWVECAYWTDRTAVAPYLLKGKLVVVEGSPYADPYLNKENQPAATLRLRVNNLQLLGGSGENNGAQSGYASQQGQSSHSGYASNTGTPTAPVAKGPEPAADDDLPF